jgi:hypothetical protein
VPTPVRRPLSVAMVGAAAAVLLLTSPGSALATPAATTVPVITVDAVSRLMPADKALPGKVHLQEKLETFGTSDESPCPENFGTLTTKSSQVLAVYTAGTPTQFLRKPVGWAIVTTVFHTAAEAQAAAAKLQKAERVCPAHSAADPSDDPSAAGPEISRSYGAPYTVGGWKGYRSIDHVTAGDPSEGDPTVGYRLIDAYLVRGNILLHIEEIGIDGAKSGPQQEAWRQSETRLLLNSFEQQT